MEIPLPPIESGWIESESIRIDGVDLDGSAIDLLCRAESAQVRRSAIETLGRVSGTRKFVLSLEEFSEELYCAYFYFMEDGGGSSVFLVETLGDEEVVSWKFAYAIIADDLPVLPSRGVMLVPPPAHRSPLLRGGSVLSVVNQQGEVISRAFSAKAMSGFSLANAEKELVNELTLLSNIRKFLDAALGFVVDDDTD